MKMLPRRNGEEELWVRTKGEINFTGLNLHSKYVSTKTALILFVFASLLVSQVAKIEFWEIMQEAQGSSKE